MDISPENKQPVAPGLAADGLWWYNTTAVGDRAASVIASGSAKPRGLFLGCRRQTLYHLCLLLARRLCAISVPH